MTEPNDPFLRDRPSALDHGRFMVLYGDVYEHSPWIAEAVWRGRIGEELDRLEGLHGAMRTVVDGAGRDRQLALIRAHPDLAGRVAVAGQLTEASSAEQAGAGLDRCTAEEYETFQSLNAVYKEKFGFPFILAVKGLGRQEILEAFRHRVENGMQQEFRTALNQIHRIAGLRLATMT